MIARARNFDLSNIVRDFKKFTSSLLIKDFKTTTEGAKQKKKSTHQVWQYNNHEEEVYSPKFTFSKIQYIHNNPVEAGLVSRPEDYLFSSAQDYS